MCGDVREAIFVANDPEIEPPVAVYACLPDIVGRLRTSWRAATDGAGSTKGILPASRTLLAPLLALGGDSIKPSGKDKLHRL
jgi:hypothetical protein